MTEQVAEIIGHLSVSLTLCPIDLFHSPFLVHVVHLLGHISVDMRPDSQV